MTVQLCRLAGSTRLRLHSRLQAFLWRTFVLNEDLPNTTFNEVKPCLHSQAQEQQIAISGLGTWP